MIGRPSPGGTPSTAREAIFGWTCLNDVSARDIQRAEAHFTRAKSYDTFCPVGPFVETHLDPMDQVVICRVNGEQRQRGSTRDMVVDPYVVVAFISQVMTLLPGDLVSTGDSGGGRAHPTRRLGRGRGERRGRPEAPGAPSKETECAPTPPSD